MARINRPVAAEGSAEAARRAPRRRIGLLGGSFNPAHQGHRSVSLQAMKQLRLNQVWWLVSPQNPLKETSGMAPFEQRLASAQSVAAGHPRLIVTDLEQRLGTRYSIDTLRWLTRRCRARFVWLIGADILLQLPQWRGWQQLVRLVPIAVVDREPYSYRALAGQAARRHAAARWPERDAPGLTDGEPPAWAYLRLRRQKASSTAIRRARRTGRRRPEAKEEAS
ncbi:MAG TPA: nicotinate-nucleotide adenylyltransferase [Geminicoccaceae bacterium]|nr:nicotinate-nucleotide adenylyltransferase [Geminicoccaceae bacterium]